MSSNELEDHKPGHGFIRLDSCPLSDSEAKLGYKPRPQGVIGDVPNSSR